ncbi:TetR/AcrR family transcriptional regulator [Streptomyces sp. NWU49]|uniref:TetR/AcrR family transcriptional regulator n=1 Tax=Streptomyces sp. NWU49 TaxID=2201153 RepID=UPI00215A548C|nr:TetR/AcrR family transcriptional regulator [Streptomyces sp. NWU49]
MCHRKHVACGRQEKQRGRRHFTALQVAVQSPGASNERHAQGTAGPVLGPPELDGRVLHRPSPCRRLQGHEPLRGTAIRCSNLWRVSVRSESSRKAILDATMDLLVRDGRHALTLKKLTIEAIAARAGVGKATIYRWWPSKVAVVIDSFMENHLEHVRIPEELPVRDALLAHLRLLIARYAGPQGKLISQIIAECQYDPAALNDLRSRFWNDQYAAVEKLVQRGIDEGVFRSDIDPGRAAQLFYAPVYLHLLFSLGPLDDSLVERLVDLGIQGVATRPEADPTTS